MAVINVGGRYFDHFLHLFDSRNENTIPKKIVCITDRDPERKEKTMTSSKNVTHLNMIKTQLTMIIKLILTLINIQ